MEGEYISELAKAKRKFKDHYTNEVGSLETIQSACRQSSNIIEKEVFPLLEKIDHLRGFQELKKTETPEVNHKAKYALLENVRAFIKNKKITS